MTKRIFMVAALLFCLILSSCADAKTDAVAKAAGERVLISQETLKTLDGELAQQAQRYNELTEALGQYYTTYAQGIAQTLYTVYGEAGVEYSQSELYRQWVTRIAHYALYEDAVARCHDDPYLSELLEKEAGGSWGMWPQQLHANAPDTVKAQLQEYFPLVDKLLTQTKIKD